MINQPLVSVVIPFYSGTEWLFEAIESVLAQTYKNIEIIVINDGSSEDFSEVLKKYRNKIRYVYQENRGAAAARNVGINLSQGEYIAFLDADDLWMPNKLEEQIYLMIKNEAVWSHTNYIRFDLEGKTKEIDVSDFRGNVFPLSLISNPIATPSVIIKKSILINNPSFRFEEDMQYGEDTILWLLLSTRYELLAINKYLVKVRMRGSNSSLRAYSQIKARADMWNKIKTKNIFNYKKEISMMGKIAFGYCSFLYKWLDLLENRIKRKHIETISKLLYIMPWILFKIEKKYLINIKKR